MAKKQKGNGGDPDPAKAVEDQLAFLDEIKAIAKKHGVDLGSLRKFGPPGQRSLKIQVREQQGKILVDFGQQIAWMAMGLDQATKLAATIIKLVQGVQKRNAIEAEGGEGEMPAEDKPDAEQEKEAEKEPVDKPD